MQISNIFCTNWVRLVERVANFLTPIWHIVRHYLTYDCVKNWHIPTKYSLDPTDSYFILRAKKLTKTGLLAYNSYIGL